jgi:hypothetical protein
MRNLIVYDKDNVVAVGCTPYLVTLGLRDIEASGNTLSRQY